MKKLLLMSCLVINLLGCSEEKKQPEETKAVNTSIKPQSATASSVKVTTKQQEQSKSKEKSKTENGVESTTKDMDFRSCVGLQTQMADALLLSKNYKVISIVDSDILKIKRMCANDGSVLVSCSMPDNKMVVTKSPHRNGC